MTPPLPSKSSWLAVFLLSLLLVMIVPRLFTALRARPVEVAAPHNPTPGLGPGSGLEDLPPDVQTSCKAMFALNPYYLRMITTEEHRKVSKLVTEGKGGIGDFEWLRTLTARVIASSAAETALMARWNEMLAGEIRRQGLADVVVLTTGERREGEIVSESDAEIQLKLRVGDIEGTRTFRREEIREVLRGRGAAVEFDARFRSAAGNVSRLEELRTWCLDNRLTLQANLTCVAILQLDPDHSAARTDLGYTLGDNAIWRR